MATITITGSSDDLIYVEGKVPGCDEYGEDEGFIELSTGDVFKVDYTRGGVWQIRHHVRAKGSAVKVTTVPHAPVSDTIDDPEPYTDTVTVTGDFAWVRFCPAWPMAAADKREAIKAAQDRDQLGIERMPAALLDQIYDYLTTTEARR